MLLRSVAGILLGFAAFTAASAQRPITLSPNPAPTPTPTATAKPMTVRLRPALVPQPVATPAPPPPAQRATPIVRGRPSTTQPAAPASPVAAAQHSPVPAGVAPNAASPTLTVPRKPVSPQIFAHLPAQGPLILTILDRGYAESDAFGAHTISIDACLADAQGRHAEVASMNYDITLPGNAGRRTGEMKTYLQPSKAPTVNKGEPSVKVPGINLNDTGNCRRATIALQPCEVPPGEIPFVIMAVAADGSAPTAKDSTIIAGYPTKITLNPLPAFEAGLPQKVSGKVTGPCGAGGASVALYSPTGVKTVEAKTASDGGFTASFTFGRSGNASLNALVGSDDALEHSETGTSLTVAQPPVLATVINQPATIALGKATAFTVRLQHAVSKIALTANNVTFSIGKSSCHAISAESGIATCAVVIPTSETIQVNSSPTLHVDVTGAQSVSLVGLGKTLVTTPLGLVYHKIPNDLGMIFIQGSKPAGVLLNSYNRSWSGTGAHLDNGSLRYDGPTFDNGTPFDIPTFKGGGFSYYIEGILLRTGTIVTAAPARITLPLTLTGSLDGHGPRMKGFCFKIYCKVVGYDDAAPDANNIALNSAYISLDLYVEAGHVKARLGPTDGSLDFSCGGIASVVCGLIRSYANDKMHEQITKIANSPAMLGTASQNIDAAIQKNLALWNIATLTDITLDPDGTITITGKPKA